ncbi:hypothetical protein TcWFU_008221 [Taenia crassiceps]|uniref:Uncharacterized protein n=1 Tax=Taenia crassiceps TaxID=6207 RepID=A0ABR4QSU7_9CEST
MNDLTTTLSMSLSEGAILCVTTRLSCKIGAQKSCLLQRTTWRLLHGWCSVSLSLKLAYSGSARPIAPLWSFKEKSTGYWTRDLLWGEANGILTSL